MSPLRLAIALVSLGTAVAEADKRGDAMCILALGVVLFISAGIFERKRK